MTDKIKENADRANAIKILLQRWLQKQEAKRIAALELAKIRKID